MSFAYAALDSRAIDDVVTRMKTHFGTASHVPAGAGNPDEAA